MHKERCGLCCEIEYGTSVAGPELEQFCARTINTLGGQARSLCNLLGQPKYLKQTVQFINATIEGNKNKSD